MLKLQSLLRKQLSARLTLHGSIVLLARGLFCHVYKGQTNQKAPYLVSVELMIGTFPYMPFPYILDPIWQSQKQMYITNRDELKELLDSNQNFERAMIKVY